MRPLMTLLVAAILVAGAAVVPAHADSVAEDVAYGAGSVFSTLLYAPFKLAFCVVGAVTAGLALPFGGPSTARKVATAACGGTWVITPATLKGTEQVHFVGQ